MNQWAKKAVFEGLDNALGEHPVNADDTVEILMDYINERLQTPRRFSMFTSIETEGGSIDTLGGSLTMITRMRVCAWKHLQERYGWWRCRIAQMMLGGFDFFYFALGVAWFMFVHAVFTWVRGAS